VPRLCSKLIRPANFDIRFVGLNSDNDNFLGGASVGEPVVEATRTAGRRGAGWPQYSKRLVDSKTRVAAKTAALITKGKREEIDFIQALSDGAIFLF
jgi:hypothetical protein